MLAGAVTNTSIRLKNLVIPVTLLKKLEGGGGGGQNLLIINFFLRQPEQKYFEDVKLKQLVIKNRIVVLYVNVIL